MDAKLAFKELMAKRITKVMVAALSNAEKIMPEDVFEQFRSRVLDCGNDQIRMLTDDLEKFKLQWGRYTITLVNKGEQS